jgi:hypothetical protein
MKHVMVRYRVKPDRSQENEALVRAVYEELRHSRPAGFQYATYVMEDGVSFVHVASVDTEDGSSPLSQVKAFKEFTAGVEERCDEAPVVSELREIGSFNLHDK